MCCARFVNPRQLQYALQEYLVKATCSVVLFVLQSDSSSSIWRTLPTLTIRTTLPAPPPLATTRITGSISTGGTTDSTDTAGPLCLL